MKNIVYLGPRNTFTEEAARLLAEKIGNSTTLKDSTSVEAVARSVAKGESDLGVMAYYNYLEGLVQECLDLIYEQNLRIIGMQRLPIVFSVAGNTERAEEVYSHPKALAQCSEWLWKNCPESKQVAVASTAAAAQKVADTKRGLAIASTPALRSRDLEIIAEDIGNKKHGRANFTDFYLVARENGVAYDPTRQYLTMVAITPHADRPGVLAEILEQVAYYNLNNAKIHSRPALDDVAIPELEPQMFYLEIMAHEQSDEMRRCIDALRFKLTPKGKNIEAVRVLGSYERP